MTDDPYRTLGVAAGASLAELTAARRRLAMTLHPDVGGDAVAMQTVNTAFDEAVRRLSLPVDPPLTTSSPTATPTATATHDEPAERVEPRRRGSMRPAHGVQHDSPSFTIDVLPVEAYEALLVVTSWMGEVLVDDPPYLLEVFLHDPSPCWCRLDLLPDAGATTVSLMVAGIDPDPTPDPEAVRDEFVANLNRLGDA